MKENVIYVQSPKITNTSSAKFYLTGEQGFYKIAGIAEMKDKVFFPKENQEIVDATSCKGQDDAAK